MTTQHHARLIDMNLFTKPNERYLLLEMAVRADRKGICRMSQSELAATTHLSLATVKRIMSLYIDMKFIKRLGHGRYYITPESCAAGGAWSWGYDIERNNGWHDDD